MKCTFLKIVILIFNFDVFSVFQPQGFIFRKMQLWYGMFCMHQCKQSSTSRQKSVFNADDIEKLNEKVDELKREH